MRRAALGFGYLCSPVLAFIGLMPAITDDGLAGSQWQGSLLMKRS